jgi:hypothetical protein
VRFLYVAGLAWVAVCAFALLRGPRPALDPTGTTWYFATGDPADDGAAWFGQAKPFCNSLEVETIHRRTPPPDNLGGAGFSAACWALAGRIDEARDAILSLEGDARWKAAGIVFAIGHPIADMGDDRSAGPIMELVIEFWPNHYQALYHAGAARFALGDFALAEQHLREFLLNYEINDGWTRSAKRMLEEIESQ